MMIAFLSAQYNSYCHDYDPKRGTGKIDPVIIQPLPAADVNRLRAAGVERMFLGLLFVGGAVIHGLHRRAEQGVEK